jgi:predicted RNase H-like HicB family nuclease
MPPMALKYRIETEMEEDGRWIAEVVDLPGVLAYGSSKEEAVSKAESLALRVLADKIESERTGCAISVSLACA